MKIVDYEIADGYKIEQIERLVTDMMEEGFQPFGNLQCLFIQPNADGVSEGFYFVQPLVKYES